MMDEVRAGRRGARILLALVLALLLAGCGMEPPLASQGDATPVSRQPTATASFTVSGPAAGVPNPTPLLESSTIAPGWIGVDEAAIYWLNSWPDCDSNPDHAQTIMRMPRAGGEPAVVNPGSRCVESVALTTSEVVWIERGLTATQLRRLMKAPKQGGAPLEIFSTFDIRGLTADDEHAFLTTCDIDVSGEVAAHSVLRVPLNGGEPVWLAQTTCADAIYADESNVYWSEGDALASMPKAGGDKRRLAEIGFLPSPGLRLVADATQLYWLSVNHIMALPRAGGRPRTLAVGSHPLVLAQDQDAIYWLDNDEGPGAGAGPSLRRVAKDGGEPTLIARLYNSQNHPPVLAVHGGIAYWGYVRPAQPNGVVHSGMLLTAPAEGGVAYQPPPSPSLLHMGSMEQQITSVLVDETTLYWAVCDRESHPRTSEVWRMPRAGGKPEQLAILPPCAMLSGIDELGLYAHAGGDLLRLDRDGTAQTLLPARSDGHSYGVVAFDQRHIYWRICEHERDNSPLFALPKAGGESVLLTDTVSCDSNLVGDDGSIYWAQGLTILKLAKSGGTPVVVKRFSMLNNERVENRLSVLAVDAEAIYVELRSAGSQGTVDCEAQSTTWLRVPKDGGAARELHYLTGLWAPVSVDSDAISIGGTECDSAQARISFSPPAGRLERLEPSYRRVVDGTIYQADTGVAIHSYMR